MAYHNGLLDVVFRKDSYVDLDCARFFVEKCVEITKNEPYACISSAETGVEYSKEARNYLAKAESKIYASALITNSPVMRITANLFLKINKPIYPTRFFSSYADALNWIEEVKCDKVGM